MKKWLEENIPHTKKTKYQTYNRDHNFCKHSEEESSEHIYRQGKETDVKEILKI